MLAEQIPASEIDGACRGVFRELVDLAIALRWMRRAQTRHLAKDLFSDPAWDMLLDLFSAEWDGAPLSVSALCAGAGVPLTTAWRNLAMLEARALVVRCPDVRDRRRTIVHLAPVARTALIEVLTGLKKEFLGRL